MGRGAVVTVPARVSRARRLRTMLAGGLVATLAAITASRTEFSAAPAISSLANTALYHCHDSPSKRLIERPELKE